MGAERRLRGEEGGNTVVGIKIHKFLKIGPFLLNPHYIKR